MASPPRKTPGVTDADEDLFLCSKGCYRYFHKKCLTKMYEASELTPSEDNSVSFTFLCF